MISRLRALGLLASGFAAAAVGCSSADAADPTTGDEDLTSLTAREREVTFQGVVYVSDGAADATIMRAVRAQAQTMFGALLTQEIAVNSRELKDVDPSTFKRRRVKVVDTNAPDAPPKTALEVKYTYVDRGLVPVALSRRSSLAAGLMGPEYPSQTSRVLRECTKNDKDAREVSDMLWYAFEPTLPQCRAAMKAEADVIKADRAKLTDPRAEVSLTEATRLYLPVTVNLGPAKTARGATYPDYHRLYQGGVQPDRMVIALVNGTIDHHPAREVNLDFGYGEWLSTINEVLAARPEMKVVRTDPPVDLSTYELEGGKTVQGLTFLDFIYMEFEGSHFPAGLTGPQKTQLKRMFAERVYRRWVHFELPVVAKVGDGPERDFTIELKTYYGSDEDVKPFKQAMKTSDVFVYNGHSYLGSGPLDPKNFRAGDFPESYQLFFIDSCISFNYYEKDYIPLKEGGTKNLDLITNGLEAPADESGVAQGQFIASLMSGRAPSYKTLLSKMTATDSLRVVDGELDNTYSPERTPVSLRVR